MKLWKEKCDKKLHQCASFLDRVSFKTFMKNKMRLWNTNAPESDKFHWQPCLCQIFWKVSQMLRSQLQIAYSIRSNIAKSDQIKVMERSCPIQPFFGPHAVWYVSYQSLSRSWHTDLDYGWYRLSNVEIGLTAGVTGQQGMLTPPWHLIPPLIYSEVRVRPFSDLYFLLDLRDWLLIVIFIISQGTVIWNIHVLQS
jgi:hypothetical protein